MGKAWADPALEENGAHVPLFWFQYAGPQSTFFGSLPEAKLVDLDFLGAPSGLDGLRVGVARYGDLPQHSSTVFTHICSSHSKFMGMYEGFFMKKSFFMYQAMGKWGPMGAMGSSS